MQVAEGKNNTEQLLKVGLIINPVAGLGGAVALKGSDGVEIVREALRRGALPKAQEKVSVFLQKSAIKIRRITTNKIFGTTWGWRIEPS